MRLLRHKKGQVGGAESDVEAEIGKQLIELILAIVIGASAIAYAVSVGSNMRIMEVRSARDLALTIEAIEGSPGNMLFSYADGFGFQYKFSTNRVEVYLGNEPTDINSLNFFFFPQDSAISFIFPKDALGPPIGQQKTAIALKKSYPQFIFGASDLVFSVSNCEKADFKGSIDVLVFYSSTDDSLRNAVNDNFKSAVLSISYYDNPSGFEAAAKANPSAIIVEISLSQEESEIKIFSLTDKKANTIACTAQNLFNAKQVSSVVLGTSSKDNLNLINPSSLKFEIGSKADYNDAIQTIVKSIEAQMQ